MELSEREDALKRIQVGRNTIYEKLKKLESDTKVQKYLKLKDEYESISKECDNEYINYVVCKCNNCDHLFAVTGTEIDYYEGRSYHHYGCLKCGVDTHLYDNAWTIDEKAYSAYMRKAHLNPTNNSKLYLENYHEFLEARSIYLEYRDKYEEISDEEIIRLIKEKIEEKKKVKKK